VRDPRGLLREFGLDLPEEVRVRVWDSTAELRYLVLPMRPAGTENLPVDELAGLVTRDAMIGTAVVSPPQP
jgi:nitrile hydratase